MKKVTIVLIISLCLLLAACGKKAEEPESVSVDLPEVVSEIDSTEAESVEPAEPAAETPEETETQIPKDSTAIREEDVSVSKADKAEIDDNMHLIITGDDNTDTDAGYIGGETKPEGFSVCFLDYDDTPLKIEFVEKSGNATPPADPMRNGLDFIGWQGNWTNVQEDTLVKACYTKSGEYFTVNYADKDGNILLSEIVPKGACAKGMEPPAEDGYIFSGWGRPLGCVTEDMTLVAEYVGNTEIMLVLDTVEVKKGEKAELTLSVNNCPGLCGISFDVEAPDAISLKEFQFNAEAEGMGTGPKTLPAKGVLKFNWFNIEKELEGDSELIQLTYSIDKNAPAGEYWILVSINEGDAVNLNEEDLMVSAICGKIVVVE